MSGFADQMLKIDEVFGHKGHLTSGWRAAPAA
jgi:hypothetical protein